MDEKAKMDLMALAMGRNEELQTGVKYDDAAAFDAGVQQDENDDGVDDDGYDVESEAAERAEMQRRNQELMARAMANNAVVQEHIKNPGDFDAGAGADYDEEGNEEDDGGDDYEAEMKKKQAQLMVRTHHTHLVSSVCLLFSPNFGVSRRIRSHSLHFLFGPLLALVF